MFIEIYRNNDKYYHKDRNLNIFHNSYGCSNHHKFGRKHYCINDKLHNKLGPALIYGDGRCNYYLNDKHYSYKEWLKRINKKDK